MTMNPNPERDERVEAPERIYIHPTSAEHHLHKWPLGESEYVEYVRADLLDRSAAGDAKWFNEWPTVNGFYWLRGWRHYGDLPINVDGNTFWMMFNVAKNHRTDLDDSEDVQFLGPITPYSAITAAARMRDRCATKLKKLRETYRAGARTADTEERNSDQLIFLHKANAMTDAVSEIQSLTLDQVEQKQ